MIYRFYTEDKHRQAVLDTVAKYHEGFTVFTGQGYWKGQAEQALVVEVQVPWSYRTALIEELAQEIRQVNTQEAVIVIGTKEASTWTITKLTS